MEMKTRGAIAQMLLRALESKLLSCFHHWTQLSRAAASCRVIYEKARHSVELSRLRSTLVQMDGRTQLVIRARHSWQRAGSFADTGQHMHRVLVCCWKQWRTEAAVHMLVVRWQTGRIERLLKASWEAWCLYRQLRLSSRPRSLSELLTLPKRLGIASAAHILTGIWMQRIVGQWKAAAMK